MLEVEWEHHEVVGAEEIPCFRKKFTRRDSLETKVAIRDSLVLDSQCLQTSSPLVWLNG